MRQLVISKKLSPTHNCTPGGEYHTGASCMLESQSPVLGAVARPRQSTKTYSICGTDLCHLAHPRKSSHKSTHPFASKKLESSLYDVQLAVPFSIAAYDLHAADIVCSRKPSNYCTRMRLRPSTKLESPLEDVRLQGVTGRCSAPRQV